MLIFKFHHQLKRLLNFDLIIISSLEEGVFHKLMMKTGLEKELEKDLKVDKFLQKLDKMLMIFAIIYQIKSHS